MTTPAHAILVWRWRDAPCTYKALSTHGGDEDWVAFVPESLRDVYIPWLERLGVCDLSEHEVYGGIVYIGAHA